MIESEADELKKNLEVDIVASYSNLLNFLELNNADSNTRNQAVLLGSNMFDFLEEANSMDLSVEKRYEILNEAYSIIDKTTKKSTSEASHNEYELLHKLRKHFPSNPFYCCSKLQLLF